MTAISEIYDAAFDPALFPQLLHKMTVAFGANSAFIAWVDQERDAGFQAEFGNDPAWITAYMDRYQQHDILLPDLMALQEGECATAHARLQTPEVRESVFYREYLAPQGIVDNLAAILIKRPGFSAHLSLLRTEPASPFSEDNRARMRELMPHLARAIFIQSRLLRDAGIAQGYRQSTTELSGCILQLSDDRKVVEIDAGLARLVGLRVGDTVHGSGFAATIAEAIDQQQPCATEVQDETGAPIRLLCESQRQVRDRFSDLVAGPSAAFVIHVTLIDQPRQIAFPAMTALYGLTPMEARVLRDAVEHGDLTGIGERLGMARATARAHLHRIYAKTGTSGFAGLASLAHRFAMAG